MKVHIIGGNVTLHPVSEPQIANALKVVSENIRNVVHCRIRYKVGG